MSDIVDSATDAVSDAASAVGDAASSAVDTVSDVGSSAWDAVESGWDSTWDAVQSGVSTVGDYGGSALESIWDTTVDYGPEIAAGAGTGFLTGGPWGALAGGGMAALGAEGEGFSSDALMSGAMTGLTGGGLTGMFTGQGGAGALMGSQILGGGQQPQAQTPGFAPGEISGVGFTPGPGGRPGGGTIGGTDIMGDLLAPSMGGFTNLMDMAGQANLLDQQGIEMPGTGGDEGGGFMDLVGDLGSSALDWYGSQQMMEDYEDLMQEQMERADRFGEYRDFYADRMHELMQDEEQFAVDTPTLPSIREETRPQFEALQEHALEGPPTEARDRMRTALDEGPDTTGRDILADMAETGPQTMYDEMEALAQDPSQIRDAPGYDYMRDQMQESVARQAGGVMEGRHMQALQRHQHEFDQDMLDRRMGRLADVSDVGIGQFQARGQVAGDLQRHDTQRWTSRMDGIGQLGQMGRRDWESGLQARHGLLDAQRGRVGADADRMQAQYQMDAGRQQQRFSRLGRLTGLDVDPVQVAGIGADLGEQAIGMRGAQWGTAGRALEDIAQYLG